MPLQEHALLVDLFRASPRLAIDLLVALGIDATGPASLVESTFPVSAPDYHVDIAVTCGDAAAPSLVVLVEVQLDVDAGKRLSWPLYQAAARARWKCDACVLVVAADARVAAWAAEPVRLGPGGSVFRAVVIGPRDVPRVAPNDDATAEPGLALLSALAHGRDEPAAITAALTAASSLGDQRARAYFDLLRYKLGDALDRALEAMMATSEHPYLSDFARKYYDDGEAKGEAKGKRDALFTILAARGLAVTADERARIESCTEAPKLDRWIASAARATTLDEALAE